MPVTELTGNRLRCVVRMRGKLADVSCPVDDDHVFT